MILNSNDTHELEARRFTPAGQRLIRRYVNALHLLGERGRLDPARIYYAAASAVECLEDGRKDAQLCLSTGGSMEDARRCRDVSRIDAEFYLNLGRGWITGRAAA